MGLFATLSQNMAPIIHALTQEPQPIHLSGISVTPPPFLGTRASTGQALAQGGSVHARQTTTVNPLSTPPTLLTIIALLSKPPSPNLLLQANIHNWHPTHRFTSTTEILDKISHPIPQQQTQINYLP